mmetsp:Transcript_35469/g.69446  ORF Transcript_35469/g.69446 Transcript_35469/m.69446 type:complete len:266 (+) Transcript_35469:259-1056(+)
MSHLTRSLLLVALLAGAASESQPDGSNMRLRGGQKLRAALSRRAPSLKAFLSPTPMRKSNPVAGDESSSSSAAQSQGSPVGTKDLDAMKQYVERVISINATPDEVFRVASGFEKYPKWAGCNWIRVLRENRAGMGFQVQMKVGMFGRNLDYTLEYQYQRPRKMTWHAVAGSIKALQGSYEFLADGPNRTKVVYKLNVDPGFWVPGAVKTGTTRVVASAALQGLKKYTELPSTLAALRGSQGCRELTEEEVIADRKRIYMLRMALL